jgi:hypothetical protein
MSQQTISPLYGRWLPGHAAKTHVPGRQAVEKPQAGYDGWLNQKTGQFTCDQITDIFICKNINDKHA